MMLVVNDFKCVLVFVYHKVYYPYHYGEESL